MSTLWLPLAFALVALGVYLGRYSGRIRIEQTRLIAAPADALGRYVDELSAWAAWNPWTAEAPAAATVGSQGQLVWDDPRAGRASVRSLAGGPNRSARQQLRFDLPFKVRGRSDWQFEPVPGGTRVTWRFKGRVGFALRAFAKTVQGALQLDMRWGLDRLAQAVTGASPGYEIEALGACEQPARKLALLAHRGRIENLPQQVSPRIQAVREQLGAAADGGAGVARYLRTDARQRTVHAQIGVELPATRPGTAIFETSAPLLTVEAPAHRAWGTRLKGSTEPLELAWYLAMQRARVEGLRPDPRHPPYERYVDDGGMPVVELWLPLLPEQ